jgi:GNAT superfamily N-acetyltransferase
VPGPEDFTIRHGRDEDVEEMVELLRAGLGEGSVPRSPELWRWKHQRSPFGPSPVVVAIAAGRLVGLRAFLRWRWVSGDREVPAVRAVDTVTHPEWQGRGIFTRLTRRLVDEVERQGVAFVFNTPNPKSGAGYLKMGWRPAGRLPVRARPLGLRARPPATAAARVAEAGRGELVEPVESFLGREETPSFLAAVEARRREDPRLRTALTADYLRWRYAEVPGLGYRVLHAGGGESGAALVLRTRRRYGLVEASIAEVLVAGAAGVATAGALLGRLRKTKLAHHAVAIASPDTDEDRALCGAGFHRLPRLGPRLFVRPFGSGASAPDPLRIADWRFATGAFELF